MALLRPDVFVDWALAVSIRAVGKSTKYISQRQMRRAARISIIQQWAHGSSLLPSGRLLKASVTDE